MFLSSWDMAIDFHWDDPAQVEFFGQLASVGRLVLFDKRGTGLSDRTHGIATLEEGMDDLMAGLDDVGGDVEVGGGGEIVNATNGKVIRLMVDDGLKSLSNALDYLGTQRCLRLLDTFLNLVPLVRTMPTGASPAAIR